VPDQHRLLAALDSLHSRLTIGCHNRLQSAEQTLKRLREKRCLSAPRYYVEEQGLRLDLLTRRFAGAAQRQLSSEDRRLTAVIAKLDALSPLKVLGRGYAIGYTSSGQVLDSVSRTAVGETVRLRVADGSLDCEIKNVEEASLS